MSDTIPGCENCERRNAEIAKLKEQLHAARATIEQLTAENLQLHETVAVLNKNSQTSHKPPSSDVMDPRPAEEIDTTPTSKDPPAGGRTIGGQPGHPGHFHQPFKKDEIDKTEVYRIECCPSCGCQGCLVDGITPPRVVQQIELVPRLIVVTEHRAYYRQCTHCGQEHLSPLPSHVQKGGLVGPELTALVAYIKGACHASYSTIRKFFRDVMEVEISRGHLARVIQKVTLSLDEAYDDVLQRLQAEPLLHVDETGHKQNKERLWTWCFRAHLYVVYKIDRSRGSQVLYEVLGEKFAGTIGCDFWGAYRKYMREVNIAVQFCLAHLLRDIEFLGTLNGEAEKQYAATLLKMIRELFFTIHTYQRLTPEALAIELKFLRTKIIEYGVNQAPDSRYCQTLANRLRDYGDSYFTFITTPTIGLTNNIAEQAIRFVVIDRKITQGTRSDKGNRWCERIWTVIATCAVSGKSVFQFLYDSIVAYWSGVPGPMLLAT